MTTCPHEPKYAKGMCRKCYQTAWRKANPEYNSWSAMINRTLPRGNPNVESWEYYGGRGIATCPEWLEFQAFFEYIGPKPEPKHLYSIDRINNDGNYEPGNVRWATDKQQMDNRRYNAKTPAIGTFSPWPRKTRQRFRRPVYLQ